MSGLLTIASLALRDTFQVWEKLKIQAKLHSEAKRSIANIDTQHILQQVDQRHQAELGGLPLTTPAEHTTFVLSEYSLPVCRSLWRIVEYVLIDFVDFWWLKISDSPEFGNDLRDVFDHAFNVLAERCIKVDWSPFIVKNVISNLNYLMRIYRLTEQELRNHNPFFSNTPESARHRLIKAELMRTYKLHVAVSNPQAYLRKLSTAILSQILRASDFRSETVRTMTREIITTFIFLPVMDFAVPYWMNVSLIKFLTAQQREKEAAEKEKNNDSSKSSKSTRRPVDSSHAYSSLTPPTSRGPSRSTSPARQTVYVAPVVNTALFSDSDESNSATSPNNENETRTQHANRQATVDEGMMEGGTRVPQRKDSLLTQKMIEWEGEKAKRQEKKHSRHAAKSSHRHMTLPTHGDEHNRDVHRTNDGTRPHDDDIPTGLMSPSGAFSHSPNHATSPLNSSSSFPAPHPSELTGHWEVRIIGAGIRFDPKPFVMYQLLVKNGDRYKWTIVKRYNKFEELHQRLKKAIPSFEAQLPKKHFFGNLDQQFIQNRKAELQTYLGQLLWNKNVQMNADLQEFLLPSPDDSKWQQQTPGSIASGSATPSTGLTASSSFSFFGPSKPRLLDDPRTPPAGGQPKPKPKPSATHATHHADRPALIAQHSLPTFSALHAADEEVNFDAPNADSRQALESPKRTKIPFDPSNPNHQLTLPSPPTSPTATHKPAPSQARTYSADDISFSHHPNRPHAHTMAPPTSTGAPPQPAATDKSTRFFSTNWEDKQLTEPLLAIFEEIFNLNGRGWVRRQATWVGKQLVKMTMDTLIKDQLNKQVDSMLNESTLTGYIDWITDIVWPNGKLFASKPPVTEEEKEQSKEEALKLLKASIPPAVKTLLGGDHCLEAMDKSARAIAH